MKKERTKLYTILLAIHLVTTDSNKNTVHNSQTLTVDGRKFLVDDRINYKGKKFTVFGTEEKDDTWGFASPDLLPLNHKGYAEFADKCQKQFKKNSKSMHEYGPLSTINFYPTTSDFRKFHGIDMVPENKQNYVRTERFVQTLNFVDKNRVSIDIMTMQECRLPQDDGGAWHVQRVGPFNSTGGYDWWQIGWSDAGMLSEALALHPEGVDVVNTVLVPVLEDGTRLGHPPVHIHHIHFVAQQGVRFRNMMRGICVSTTGVTQLQMDSLVKEKNCYNSSLFFEQHGDYQCRVEDDGIECLTAGDHNTRRVQQALDVEGELNDVRPFFSKPMKWYYQVALRWRPIDKHVRAVSQMTIMAPGQAIIDDQLSRVITFPTPTFGPHLLWYTGHMWANGEMIRNKLHAHNMVFESSAFFVATPADLGLDKPRFLPKASWAPMSTVELGFENNDALAALLLSNLKASQLKFDRLCSQQLSPNDPACSRPRPQLLCAAIYDSENFNYFDPPQGFKMDRRPQTWCDPWSFKQGDQFVVVGFSRKLTEPTLPAYPTTIPPIIPGHISWHFWYFHEDWHHSFFGRVICNQEGIFFDAADKYGLSDIVGRLGSIVLEGGIPRFHATHRIIRTIFVFSVAALFVIFAYFSTKKKRD